MRGASSDPPGVADLLWSGWEGQVAWDVGGHAGESLPQLTDLFARVESFEPAAESYNRLREDWGQALGVGLHHVALSDHDGTLIVSMRRVPFADGQLTAMDMPYEDFQPGVTSPTTESLPWGREVGQREVACRAADSVAAELGVPDFCKIDTEGHELQILQGATGLLAEGKTGFMIEFHAETLKEGCTALLEANGYQVQVIRHPHYPPDGYLWRQHGWIRAARPV